MYPKTEKSDVSSGCNNHLQQNELQINQTKQQSRMQLVFFEVKTKDLLRSLQLFIIEIKTLQTL